MVEYGALTRLGRVCRWRRRWPAGSGSAPSADARAACWPGSRACTCALPTSCPSSRIRLTRSGRSAARAPTTKKVALTSCAARMSRILGVHFVGPSSKVSTTCRSGTLTPGRPGLEGSTIGPPASTPFGHLARRGPRFRRVGALPQLTARESRDRQQPEAADQQPTRAPPSAPAGVPRVPNSSHHFSAGLLRLGPDASTSAVVPPWCRPLPRAGCLVRLAVLLGLVRVVAWCRSPVVLAVSRAWRGSGRGPGRLPGAAWDCFSGLRGVAGGSWPSPLSVVPGEGVGFTGGRWRGLASWLRSVLFGTPGSPRRCVRGARRGPALVGSRRGRCHRAAGRLGPNRCRSRGRRGLRQRAPRGVEGELALGCGSVGRRGWTRSRVSICQRAETGQRHLREESESDGTRHEYEAGTQPDSKPAKPGYSSAGGIGEHRFRRMLDVHSSPRSTRTLMPCTRSARFRVGDDRRAFR